jgi:septal ring-binding cell division protein DamX
VMVIAGALGGFLALYYAYGPGSDAATKTTTSQSGEEAALKGGAPAEPLIRIGRLSYELGQVPEDTPPASVSDTGVASPRVIEGRDFVLPVPAASSKNESTAGSLASTARSALESSGSAPGSTVVGVFPIRPTPQALQRADATATSNPARPAESELESRLATTREWLAASAETTHTLQLFGANSEQQLKADLATLSGVLSSSELRVYRTLIAGKPAYTVVYGAYADRRAALQALDKLPASVAVNRPLVRTVNGIRAEQQQHGI